MDSKQPSASPHSSRGYLLLEALVTLLLFALASAFAMPTLWDWQEEKELDLAAGQLAAAIREAEIEARSGSSSIAASTITFYCSAESDGRVTYETRRATKLITPRGKLPPNIRAGGSLQITFRKDSFAGSDGKSKYSIVLRTKDSKYQRQIVVAMYTGRVRVVKK